MAVQPMIKYIFTTPLIYISRNVYYLFKTISKDYTSLKNYATFCIQPSCLYWYNTHVKADSENLRKAHGQKTIQSLKRTDDNFVEWEKFIQDLKTPLF